MLFAMHIRRAGRPNYPFQHTDTLDRNAAQVRDNPVVWRAKHVRQSMASKQSVASVDSGDATRGEPELHECAVVFCQTSTPCSSLRSATSVSGRNPPI